MRGNIREKTADYYAEIFVWDTTTLEPVITPIRLNGAKNIGDSYTISSNTNRTAFQGSFNFIPASDGYYDVQVAGTNIKMDGVLGIEDTLYTNANAVSGYEFLPLLSKAGVSTKNHWSYELKAGKIYSLKLSNDSGTGAYTCSITKNNNLLQTATVRHNEPVISTGMTPIKWVGDTVEPCTTSDPDWYDYRTSVNKWANVRLNDGSMFVWIPRFAYKTTAPTDAGKYNGKIDIVYLSGTTNTPYYGSISGYTVHPAFNPTGGSALSGIWVAKFQASNDSNRSNLEDSSVGYAHFVPDKPIWRGNRINYILSLKDKFNATTNNQYGLTSAADTHLLKNSEWAAVAYLGYSVAGNIGVAMNIGEEQTDDRFYVESGGGDYLKNVEQSTTHNVYGVYDMSGAALEYVAAYDPTKASSTSSYLGGSSGGLGMLATKYVEQLTATANNPGHALNETPSWGRDIAVSPDSDDPIYMRGDYSRGSTSSSTTYPRDRETAGLFAYSKAHNSNTTYRINSWRAAIWVGSSTPSTKATETPGTALTYDTTNPYLDNPYQGRMENAQGRHYGASKEKLTPTPSPLPIWMDVVHVNLPWKDIMPSGTINKQGDKYVITGSIATSYIEGTVAGTPSTSPALAYWRNKKTVTAVIRVVLEDPNDTTTTNRIQLPQWLITGINTIEGANAAGFTYTDYRSRPSYQPNYNSPGLIAAHEFLIKELAKIYNDDPFISFVQLGSLGRYGEWNYDTDSPASLGLWMPDTALADKYVRPYVRYFNKKPLMMRYSNELGLKYEASLYEDMIGVQDTENDIEGVDNFLRKANDSFAFNLRKTGTSTYVKEQEPAMPYYWRTGAVTGEFGTGTTNDGLDRTWKDWIIVDNYFPTTLRQIKDMHASFVKFNFDETILSATDRATAKTRITQVLGAMGSRLWVKAVNAKSSISKASATDKTITLTWRNGDDSNGTAPFYFDWDVVVRITNSSGVELSRTVTNPGISRCMPGQDYYQNITLDLTNVPNGSSYNIQVGILSPYGSGGFIDKTMLRLANSGTSDNTWFTVKSSVTITN